VAVTAVQLELTLEVVALDSFWTVRAWPIHGHLKRVAMVSRTGVLVPPNPQPRSDWAEDGARMAALYERGQREVATSWRIARERALTCGHCTKRVSCACGPCEHCGRMNRPR